MRGNRVQLKPFPSVTEHIDGAWWPRSAHLVDELPDLVASMAERLGRVVMVGYHRNGWDETPPLVEIAGQTVELLGFASGEPASVIVIGEDGRHVALHVIEPDTGEEAAEKALQEVRGATSAGDAPANASGVARSVAEVADKLARHEGRADEQRTAEIRRWCEQAAQQFVAAPVQAFVPILVEHIVRNRMIESGSNPVAAGH